MDCTKICFLICVLPRAIDMVITNIESIFDKNKYITHFYICSSLTYSNEEQYYNKISDFFADEERKKRLKVKTQFKMFYESAITFDYSKIEYDMVLTSPPYYFLEKYSNNVIYDSKTEMKDKFYIPVITNSFNHLKEHGYYCLNVNEQIYEDICVILLGKAHQKISLKKSKRQNEYTEYIYIWKKGYKISQIL